MTTATTYDIGVIGATPSGIVAAVRSAREGHTVLLTQHTRHIGGMCTNGLGTWEAYSDHRRCPIFREILERAETHYRAVSGEDSRDHRVATFSRQNYPPGVCEPSVAEKIFNDLVDAEPRITVALGVYPEAAQVTDGTITELTLRRMHGDDRQTVRATCYIDASYEADLAAVAGVPYRVGREGRDDYGEPHAGLLFTTIRNDRDAPAMAARGALNVSTRRQRQGVIDPASPFTGDHRIQAYNIRGCLTNDPAKRIMPEKPSAYDRDAFVRFKRKSLHIPAEINGKNSYNAAILPGENWDYPEGDWATRQRIYARHREFALGLMYFLHNDDSIPADQQQAFREWGLPSDEYTDNGHVPYEMYVRETRRIVGRHVLTEHDLAAPETGCRPQPFADSIAFTDWYMDSHSCSKDLGTWGPGDDVVGSPDYPFEGKLILMEEFRPGMIPYRSLVPQGCDNLLMANCISTTHVAWGGVRLEPTLMHLGEVAGFAASRRLKHGETFPSLDVSALQTTLLNHNAAIAFFNQHATAADQPDYADRQLAACHGEHDGYDL